MREGGRWTTVTPSQYEHERKALKHIRDLLPDSEPYRAWSNFTFTADTGHTPEVDLLVAAPSGLYLIEIKSWNGRLTASGRDWLHNGHVKDNPLHLANTKAQKLKSLLVRENQQQRTRVRVPFIQHVIFLSEPGLRIELPPNQRHWLYGPEPAAGAPRGPLPSIISDLLLTMPSGGRGAVDAATSRALPGLLSGIGIARSRKYFQVGSWDLDAQPYDVGRDWEDRLASHRELPDEHRRIRVYLVERNAAQTERASIERAARREMQVLHDISHPGIVQADTLERHENGPALIFRHPRQAMRLDHYMTAYGSQLDIDTRLGLIRQLAEATAYAHRRRLHHRTLSARSILVAPGEYRRPAGSGADPAGDTGSQDAATEAWLRPRLQISDWQTAIRTTDSLSPGSTGRPVAAPSSNYGRWVDTGAEPYLAPEMMNASAPDGVAMDIFGLGALSYLLLTGRPPAADRTELLARVGHDNGLRPGAVAESVTPFMDELVQLATRPVAHQRLSTVAEFLERLERVEDDLTAPDTADDDAQEEVNPLEARPGDLVGGEWRIKKRLGTGSTSRAFLAHNERTKAQEVLKVALSGQKAERLVHEATVLGAFPSDSRVIRLKRPDTVEIAGHTVLVLEHAGEYTVARKLREGGRLEPGELETFSEYLFGAADFLEGEGVFHRDIKPDNIAIRVRPNRTKQLVLFDFSLASISVRDTQAGTPRYLDPFIGLVGRPVYDAHAERYALAVTLHEMASNELPVWGDGATEPRYVEEPITLAREAFDPSLRKGLTRFFTKALARDTGDRFESLQDMHRAWRRVFDDADARHSGGSGPRPTGLEADEDPEKAQRARDQAAAKATLSTPLAVAGLTERAISAAHRLNAVKIEDLLPLAGRITALPGLGAKTRKELQSRIKEWRTRLGPGSTDSAAQRKAAAREVAAAEREAAAAAATTANGEGAGAEAATEPGAASATPSAPADSVPDPALARVGLDSIAAVLVPAPQKNRGNENEVETTRLILGLPNDEGKLPDLPMWPTQRPVADRVGVTTARVGQILVKQRKRWARMPVMNSVRAELVELLADTGRVAGLAELADALLARRGCAEQADDIRRALATAVVRAAIEADAGAALNADTENHQERFLTRRRGERLLVALEVMEDDDPDVPSATALIDYALKLGEIADRLAGQEVLPTSASVLRELTAVRAESFGLLNEFDHGRLVRLAAAASANAAASPRLEIYPRDLSPVRALRLSQAGIAPPDREGSGGGTTGAHSTARTGRSADQRYVLRPEQVQERVRARFPELAPLPDHPRLQRLLQEAGFEVSWRGTTRRGGYVAPRGSGSTTGTDLWSLGRRTGPLVSYWHADSPQLAAAVRARQRLAGARQRDGLRALTVSVEAYTMACEQLVRRFGAQPVDLTELFTGALKELVARNAKPTWETVLEADAAEPGTVPYHRLHNRFVEPAWEVVRPRLEAMLAEPVDGPLLLHGASPLARYDRMQLPLQLAETSRTRGIWLLCPMDDPTVEPMVDQAYVPLETKEQWIILPDAWVLRQDLGPNEASAADGPRDPAAE